MGNHTKGQRVAKPDSPGSVSAAKNGVTTAIFVKLEPDERRMLDGIGEANKLPLGLVIRALIVEAHLRRTGKWKDGQRVPVEMRRRGRRGRTEA